MVPNLSSSPSCQLGCLNTGIFRRPLALVTTALTTPICEATRTALSTNLDSATGKRIQVLTNSRLEMGWVAGELRIRCKTTLMNLDPDRAMQRPMRGDRGLL